MNEPLSLDDARALRHDGDLGKFIHQQMAAARVECARRRGLVLRHPDLAERLTQPPFRFTRPERWNGFVPPAEWMQRPNDDPGRPILLALIAEAEAREAAGRPPVAD